MMLKLDNEAVEMIARIVDLPIQDIRIVVSQDGTAKDAKDELRGLTRGQLIQRWLEDLIGLDS